MKGSFPRFAAGRRYRVLLVEDDANDVELIQIALKQFDEAVWLQVAYNGREAMDYLCAEAGENTVPNLIVCDIKMPIMDGFAFLHWFKTKSPHRRKPVVMLSSSLVDRDVARGAGERI